MAKEIDKIIQSKTAPKSNNVLWDDGENLKINRNGKWESTGSGLNIDPELMDYFINPIAFKSGDKVPEALYDKENDTLKGIRVGRIYPYAVRATEGGGNYAFPRPCLLEGRKIRGKLVLVLGDDSEIGGTIQYLHVSNGIVRDNEFMFSL